MRMRLTKGGLTCKNHQIEPRTFRSTDGGPSSSATGSLGRGVLRLWPRRFRVWSEAAEVMGFVQGARSVPEVPAFEPEWKAP